MIGPLSLNITIFVAWKSLQRIWFPSKCPMDFLTVIAFEIVSGIKSILIIISIFLVTLIFFFYFYFLFIFVVSANIYFKAKFDFMAFFSKFVISWTIEWMLAFIYLNVCQVNYAAIVQFNSMNTMYTILDSFVNSSKISFVLHNAINSIQFFLIVLIESVTDI